MAGKGVTLINPFWSDVFVGPHIGLAILASRLEEHDIPANVVEFLDSDCPYYDSYQAFSKVEEGFIERTADVSSDSALIGITASHEDYHRALKIADACRQANPQALIVIGGSMVNMLARREREVENLLTESGNVDGMIIGEAENSIVPLYRAAINRAELGHVPSLLFRDETGEIHRTGAPARLQTKELMTSYRIDWSKYERIDRRPIHLVAARGCPYKCSFCLETAIWDYRYTYSHAVHLAENLEAAYRLGCRVFSIEDSTLLRYPQVEHLCEEIKRRAGGINWMCWSTAKDILRDTACLDSLQQAGCSTIVFGIESANDQVNVLTQQVSKVNTSTAHQAVEKLLAAGIEPQGTFLLAYPGESLDDIRKTIAYGLEFNLAAHRWHVYMPSWWSDWEKDISDLRSAPLLGWKNVFLNVPNNLLAESLTEAPVQAWCDEHTLVRLLSIDYDGAASRGDMSKIRIGANWLSDIYETIGETLSGKRGNVFDEAETYKYLYSNAICA